MVSSEVIDNNGQQDLIEISRFIIELTAMGGMDNDLENLLARLFALIAKLPLFHIQPKGVIRMYNPHGKLVTIAQHGFLPIWQDPAPEALFTTLSPCFCDEVFVGSLATGEQAFVLPLTNNQQQVGQTVILIAHHYLPTGTELEFLTNLARAISGLVSRCLINMTLQVREIELEEARTQAIRRLGSASEYRDNETGMHIMRMTNISVVIAKALGLPEDQRELLFITAPMHDVGKIGIADAILLKPGKLTENEFDLMKAHTEIGERLLHGSDKLIEAARDIALSHHENWDGSGYPHGLQGDKIPILARICSVADVFDALTSIRPYKEAWPVQQAIDWIIEQSGKKFDPVIVEAFETALPEILRIRELYREDIIDPKQTLNLPPLVSHATRWVSWDDSLSVGIDVIDEHHRYLFDLTNDLIDGIANKLGAYEVSRIFKALSLYVEVHFKAEERMMERYCFERIDYQKQQHKLFNAKLKEFYQELHDNPMVAQFEVMTYLKEWLVAHIRHEDTQLQSLTI